MAWLKCGIKVLGGLTKMRGKTELCAVVLEIEAQARLKDFKAGFLIVFVNLVYFL